MKNNLGLVDFWRPARAFSPWFQDVEKALDPFAFFPENFRPPVDLEETDTHYLLSFDLPGISKDDLKIEVVENQLTIWGQRKQPAEEKNHRHFAERSYGEFKRTFTLPVTIDTAHVEASYRDGVLQISVPKSESAKPHQIKISE